MPAGKKGKSRIFWAGALLTITFVYHTGCGGAGKTEGAPPNRDAASTKSAQTGLEVQTTTPSRMPMARKLTVPANFEAYLRTDIHSRVAGYLEWIGVDIGDRVREGETLAKLLVPEMLEEHQGAQAKQEAARRTRQRAIAEVDRAKADRELKKITYERVSAVREEDPSVIPQQRVDEARLEYEVADNQVKVFESEVVLQESRIKQMEAEVRRFEALIAYADLRAPFDGVVTERFQDPGALVQAGIGSKEASPVVTLAQTDTIRVFADVPEKEVLFVHKGDRVDVFCDALPDHLFEGSVTRFSSALEPSTRTMRMEIDLPNRSGLLKPGMYGKVILDLEERPNALVVPVAAVRAEQDGTCLYLVQDGRAKRVPVETGLFDATWVEIVKGLRGGEKVVVASRGTLFDTAEVKGVELKPTGDRP